MTVGLAWPGSWSAYLLGLISLFLGISISFTLRFLVNLIAFWTLDVRGFIGLYIVVVGPFSGLFVPVHFFPEWLRVVAYATPFPSMLQTPIDVLSGWAAGWAAAALVASQLAWLVGLIGLARLVQRRAGWWCRVAELSSTEAYRIHIGSRIRGQLANRTSFWLNVATSVAVGLVEFIEIYAVFANVPIFGGLDLRQSALVFALANMGFALADVIFGQLDTIPTYLRLGRLEVLLVRPMPLLLQLITVDFQLRRLGRLVVGVLIILAVQPGLAHVRQQVDPEAHPLVDGAALVVGERGGPLAGNVVVVVQRDRDIRAGAGSQN